MDHKATELKQSEKEKQFRKEYSDLEPIPLAPQYKPIMPVHFDELNKIWPENPRIPSVQSRKAWALARGLNPVNVNNWWYRRRKVAKKLKFSIPRDTYELEIGNPPLIPAPIIKEEPKVVVLDCTEPGEDHVGDDDHTVTSPETHIPGSDDTCFSMDSTIAPSSPIMADKDTMKIITDEDHAYISPKEHLCNDSTPSSPSISLNSFPCELFLHSDNSEDVYYTAARPLYRVLVAGSLEDQEIPWPDLRDLSMQPDRSSLFTIDADTDLDSFMSLYSHNTSSALADIDLSCRSSAHHAPWCLAGLRIYYDGSLAGTCSCLDVMVY